MREREPGDPALARYDEIAHILTGDPATDAAEGVRWIQALGADLRVPPLATYGVTRADFPALVEKTAVASSTKANPIKLTLDELEEILTLAW